MEDCQEASFHSCSFQNICKSAAEDEGLSLIAWQAFKSNQKK
jgi:hypothetical protein